MTKNPTTTLVPYGTLSVADIGKIGIDAACAMFAHLLSGVSHEEPDAHLRAAMDLDGADGMTQADEHTIGNGQQYAKNTSLDGGKLETVNEHGTDSGEEARELGIVYNDTVTQRGGTFGDDNHIEPDDNDPRNWTGGAFAMGRVRLGGKVYTKRFGFATSGIEGNLDKVVSKAGAHAMAAAWELDMTARFDAGESIANVYTLAA